MAKKAKQKQKFFAFVGSSIMLIISIIVALLLCVSYFSRSVNPNDFVLPSLLGLLSPGLYVLCLCLFLYWVILWKVPSLFLLVVLAFGIPNIGLFLQISPQKEYEHKLEKKRGDFTLLSYNVMGFINDEDDSSSMIDVLDYVNELSPEIICLQEYQSTPKVNSEMINEQLSKYPYKRIKYEILNYDHASGWGLAIYSKFPIINSKHIDFENSSNAAMWVDIKMGKDTIRVYNVHLQTTSVKRADRDFILGDVPSDVKAKDKINSITSKISSNNKIRAKQADTLRLNLDASPYPVILCGDFNDTAMSYSYKKIRGEFKDAYCEKGRGLSPTYGGMVRIDHVLFSPKLSAKSYQSPKVNYSDHVPVIVTFNKL